MMITKYNTNIVHGLFGELFHNVASNRQPYESRKKFKEKFLCGERYC